jgi:hypothetical protein
MADKYVMTQDKELPVDDKLLPKTSPDEDAGVMVYGNLKIRDKDTGKILVNKRT